ncbi:hypothetical protein J4426_01275 [Candidatus Woesearchaeota archaeon]|nr:hypothetical protein [Candidatus Woesearchaeota archaeon]
MKRKFLRQRSMNVSKLERKWRRPKGIHAKLRLSRCGHGLTPRVGYGTGKCKKGLVNGLKLVWINGLNDLEKIESNKEIGIVSSKVGTKKKVEIVEKAKKTNVKIINIRDFDAYIKSVEEKRKKSKEGKIKKEEVKKEIKKEKKESTEEKAEKVKEEKRKILEKGV